VKTPEVAPDEYVHVLKHERTGPIYKKFQIPDPVRLEQRRARQESQRKSLFEELTDENNDEEVYFGPHMGPNLPINTTKHTSVVWAEHDADFELLSPATLYHCLLSWATMKGTKSLRLNVRDVVRGDAIFAICFFFFSLFSLFLFSALLHGATFFVIVMCLLSTLYVAIMRYFGFFRILIQHRFVLLHAAGHSLEDQRHLTNAIGDMKYDDPECVNATRFKEFIIFLFPGVSFCYRNEFHSIVPLEIVNQCTNPSTNRLNLNLKLLGQQIQYSIQRLHAVNNDRRGPLNDDYLLHEATLLAWGVCRRGVQQRLGVVDFHWAAE